MDEPVQTDPSGLAAPPACQPVLRAAKRRLPTVVLTICLGVLSVGLILVMRWAENRYGKEMHGYYHWQGLERSLLIQMAYEQEPPAVRWLSGYLSTKSFFVEQNALALAAERDGYLALHSRQALALLAHRAGDFKQSAYWRDGPPDHFNGPSLHPDNREAIRQWKPEDRPDLAGLLSNAGSTLPTNQAGRLYWINAGALWGVIFLGILFLPAGRAALRLLGTDQDSLVRHNDPFMDAWRPGMMLGGWLRASWLFGFSGIVVTACYYLAGMTMAGWTPFDFGGGKVQYAESFLHWYSVIFEGWHGWLLYAGLIAGPVHLLVRKFAGGWSNVARIFHLRTPGMRWPGMFYLAAGAAWIALIPIFMAGPMLMRLGWFDCRDQWRFTGESLPLALFYGCLLAPLVEEIIYRGFLFSAFVNKWTALRAALFSSLIFAAVHAYSGSGFVIITLSGILFCGLFRRTGSLWPGILAHAMINLFLLLLQFSD